ncbi:MAG: acyl-CoA thioesterase [Campylobacter sp.]|nr:acyl-CoA thioesterase [Campylobacter sp.]
MSEMGEAKIKVVAMPRDTNPSGNVFGGWILSNIDLAGAVTARELSPERVVTISMKEVVFKEPVFRGDLISCYTKIIRIGITSITIIVEVIAERISPDGTKICVPVTTAEVTYVSVDKAGNKKPIDPALKKSYGF